MAVRTPLAWKNLTHDGRRLAVAVCGVGFAVVLIFMELGFLNALLESTVQVLRGLNGGLVILSSVKYTLPATERFDLRRVQQAQGLPGVKAAFPFYMENDVLREHQARGYPIRILAFDPADAVFQMPSISVPTSAWERPGTALADTASRGKYGIPQQDNKLPSYNAELAGQRVSLVGRFHMGVDFASDGNLLMTAANFARFFPHRAPGKDPLSQVDLAVVQLESGADPIAVRQTLRRALAKDVEVLTKDELITREMNFWRTSSPVGYIFRVGVIMGFIVGVIICYQIIFADISDHMREFATLKAMGYTNGYFLRLVLSQSVYLSMMGFVPGAVLSYISYAGLAEFTGLTMNMTFWLAITVLLITMAMCIVSGMLAVRKLLSLDPAELF